MKSKILLCLRYTDAVRSLWGLRGMTCDLPTGTPRPGRLESQRWVTTVTGVGEDLEKLEMLCVINRFCLHNVAEPHNGKLVTQKRNDVLMRATTRINLENMLRPEVSPDKKEAVNITKTVHLSSKGVLLSQGGAA